MLFNFYRKIHQKGFPPLPHIKKNNRPYMIYIMSFFKKSVPTGSRKLFSCNHARAFMAKLTGHWQNMPCLYARQSLTDVSILLSKPLLPSEWTPPLYLLVSSWPKPTRIHSREIADCSWGLIYKMEKELFTFYLARAFTKRSGSGENWRHKSHCSKAEKGPPESGKVIERT